MHSISTIFLRDSPALIFSVLSALSIAIGYVLFRPFSWSRVFGRCPLFLVTGGALIVGALAALPETMQKFFERHLGHSIYQMVYERQSSGTVFGELWTNRWWEHLGSVFDCMILVSAVWAILNLSRRYAVRANVQTLLLVFCWGCLILWASASMLF